MPGLNTTSRAAGGKITGLLALTMQTNVALDTGDWVHINADYEVALSDGSKPVLGRVSVRNSKAVNSPTSRTVGVADIPGTVTVEARGLSVETVTAGAAIVAGTLVGIGAGGTLVPAGAGVATIGLALMAAAAAGDDVDVLMTSAA